MTSKTTGRRSQAERKADTIRDLIRAAVVVFARKGYHRTTLMDVAKEAGYTAGLVNHRFGSKTGLLKAMIDHLVDGFFNGTLRPSASGKSAEQALTDYVATYVKEVANNRGGLRALYAMMGEAMTGADGVLPEIQKFDEHVRAHAAEILKRGVDAGDFRATLNIDMAAVMITGLVRGVAMQYMINPKAFDIKAAIPMLQQSVLDTVR